MTIAQIVKNQRKIAGWSQSELARRSGLSNSGLSQIERGNRIPSLKVAKRLADVFKISVEMLTGFKSSTASDANLFYRQFGDIEKLSDADQELVLSFVRRLRIKK